MAANPVVEQKLHEFTILIEDMPSFGQEAIDLKAQAHRVLAGLQEGLGIATPSDSPVPSRSPQMQGTGGAFAHAPRGAHPPDYSEHSAPPAYSQTYGHDDNHSHNPSSSYHSGGGPNSQYSGTWHG